MKVIVTGGAGFIGSNLVEFLAKNNFDVTVLDNFSIGRLDNLSDVLHKIDVVDCDISVEGAWVTELADADYVVHLAALADIVPSIQSPGKYYQANVTGTLNILEGLKGKKAKKLIYAASSSCYGIPKFFPTNEVSKISPQYPYALTKNMGEQLVEHWSKIYQIPSISLRLFNVYGPKARTSGTYGAVLGVFLAQKLAKKPLTIVGGGEQTRDFTFVSDVVSAINVSMLSEKEEFCIYNVGSGTTVSVNTIAEIIGGATVHIPKRPGEPSCTFGDITKIQRELNWSPKIGIEEGMQLLMANLSYWRNAPVWDEKAIKEATKDWFKYLG